MAKIDNYIIKSRLLISNVFRTYNTNHKYHYNSQFDIEDIKIPQSSTLTETIIYAMNDGLWWWWILSEAVYERGMLSVTKRKMDQRFRLKYFIPLLCSQVGYES